MLSGSNNKGPTPRARAHDKSMTWINSFTLPKGPRKEGPRKSHFKDGKTEGQECFIAGKSDAKTREQAALDQESGAAPSGSSLGMWPWAGPSAFPARLNTLLSARE